MVKMGHSSLTRSLVTTHTRRSSISGQIKHISEKDLMALYSLKRATIFSYVFTFFIKWLVHVFLSYFIEKQKMRPRKIAINGVLARLQLS